MTTEQVHAVRARRPMSLWRLEWLRMIRTPRAISLGGVYLAFGLLGPLIASHLGDIVKHAQSGITIIVPNPTPRDGISEFISQSSQTGLIIVIVVAAGAMTFDSHRGISTFLRTRCPRMRALLVPRYAVSAAAAVIGYTIGTAAAWYETGLLLGALPIGPMLGGWLCTSVFLLFAVALVAAAASVVRGMLATIGVALFILFALPVLGVIVSVHDWLPTTLLRAPIDLLADARLADYTPALVITAAITPLLLVAADFGLRRRDG
jgi:ABC-2 type transport system permease protein